MSDSFAYASFINTAFDFVEDARKQGHLLYHQEYFAIHPHLSQAQKYQLHFGFTSHTDLFGQSQHPVQHRPNLEFRLQPNVSASFAIECMLTRGETIIDCGTAIVIAQYYAVLLACRAKYGKNIGDMRFDVLFGRKDKALPAMQRMLFTANPLNGVVGPKFHEMLFLEPTHERFVQLNPLAFILTINDAIKQHYSKIQAASSKQGKAAALLKAIQVIPVGSFVGFKGSEHYWRKHPAGLEGNFNCIFTGTNASTINLKTFGLGAVTSDELTLLHVAQHSLPRTEADHIFVAKHGEDGKYRDQITTTDVPGVDISSCIIVDDSNFELLVEADLKEAVAHLQRFIKQQKQARANFSLKWLQNVQIQVVTQSLQHNPAMLAMAQSQPQMMLELFHSVSVVETNFFVFSTTKSLTYTELKLLVDDVRSQDADAQAACDAARNNFQITLPAEFLEFLQRDELRIRKIQMMGVKFRSVLDAAAASAVAVADNYVFTVPEEKYRSFVLLYYCWERSLHIPKQLEQIPCSKEFSEYLAIDPYIRDTFASNDIHCLSKGVAHEDADADVEYFVAMPRERRATFLQFYHNWCSRHQPQEKIPAPQAATRVAIAPAPVALLEYKIVTFRGLANDTAHPTLNTASKVPTW